MAYTQFRLTCSTGRCDAPVHFFTLCICPVPSALPGRGPEPGVVHAVFLSQRDPIQSAKPYPNAQSIGIFVEPPHDDTSEVSRLRRSAGYAAGACQIRSEEGR